MKFSLPNYCNEWLAKVLAHQNFALAIYSMNVNKIVSINAHVHNLLWWCSAVWIVCNISEHSVQLLLQAHYNMLHILLTSCNNSLTHSFSAELSAIPYQLEIWSRIWSIGLAPGEALGIVSQQPYILMDIQKYCK